MNITDFKNSLDYLVKAEVTPFIWGHAGIGKSSIVKQWAQSKGYKFFPFYLGTQSDLGDILGLASFVKDENGSEIATRFATPLWLKEMIDYCEANPESGAVVFLDEFNRARNDILNGMFSLALDKTFHTTKLPKNCHVIAAGNPPTDEYNTTDVNETALMARFAHIKLEPTFKEWEMYAKQSEFEPTIISFLQEQPELIEDKKTNFTPPVKVDRRSYERLNRLFKVETPKELLEQLMLGIIGAERTVAYKLHLQKTEKPLSAEQVFSGMFNDVFTAWSSPQNTKSSLLSITCDNLHDAVKEGKVSPNVLGENLTVFLETIPKDLSYALIRKLVSLQDKEFKNYYTDARWANRLIDIAKAAKGQTK